MVQFSPTIIVTEIELRFVDEADTIAKLFKLTDIPQKIFIKDSDNGDVEFKPALDDFTEEAIYYIFFKITFSDGTVVPVPPGKEELFKVRTDFS